MGSVRGEPGGLRGASERMRTWFCRLVGRTGMRQHLAGRGREYAPVKDLRALTVFPSAWRMRAALLRRHRLRGVLSLASENPRVGVGIVAHASNSRLATDTPRSRSLTGPRARRPQAPPRPALGLSTGIGSTLARTDDAASAPRQAQGTAEDIGALTGRAAKLVVNSAVDLAGARARTTSSWDFHIRRRFLTSANRGGSADRSASYAGRRRRPMSAPTRTLDSRDRWAAAVAAVPLESPQPLPVKMQPFARALSGLTHSPRYTTGPATRAALRAAGASAATSRGVLHLATMPGRRGLPLGVLSHELFHAHAAGVVGPRFMLTGHLSGGDDDERAAQAIGHSLGGGAFSSAPVAHGRVANLPVTGFPAAMGALMYQTNGPSSFSRVPPQLISAGTTPRSGSRGDAVVASMQPRVERRAPERPVTEAAGTSAEVGVTGPGTVDTIDGLLSNGTNVPHSVQTNDTAGGAAGESQDASAQRAQVLASTAWFGAGLDVDRLLEALECRVLHEIERRGGYYQGAF